MEPGTGLALLGAGFGTKDLIVKILGPTADYIGDGVKNWAERRVANIQNIFQIAEHKLGEKLETPDQVPPKILKELLDYGSFCEDQITAEYFGGVLASSRSDVSRDDRGISFVSLISRLSTYQIRMHYVCYHIIKKLFDGTNLPVTTGQGREALAAYFAHDSFIKALDLTGGERHGVIFSHVSWGLLRESLLDEGYFAAGGFDSIRRYHKSATGAGFVFAPSPMGTELFLWANGYGDLPVNEYLNSQVVFELHENVIIEETFSVIQK